jgi:transglutaminase/protease-like cytokinesis protein 3
MMENYYKDPQRYQKHHHFSDSPLYKDDDEYFIYMSTWVNKINEVLAKCVTEGMSEKEKVKAVHDYLILHTTYEKTYYKGNETSAAHMARYIFTEGKGVCEAYAEAFKMLMNAVGIECIMTPGEAGGVGHAWNQVKVDGNWYNIDVTWDDPDDGDKIRYDYFCIPDSTISKTHTVEKGFKPYECTAPALKLKP